jgi:hypothetical protein
MLWLVAILMIAVFVLVVCLVLNHFRTRAMVEAETLEYRIAIEFAAGMDTFADAGAFIIAWSRAPEQPELRAYPAFAAYRVDRIHQEQMVEAGA